uniref:Uncharacterized protein n=1 Tax=Picocystis salinarum TaxID=88271 RepID=A0A7S3XDX4_9CHLO|mmetsp:Transcript_10891/g.67297  ORF Transcript_10891/g.67297 Transcript_10891/m.67297 type:complete len:206 (-) Transcript_10891:314-931(-)
MVRSNRRLSKSPNETSRKHVKQPSDACHPSLRAMSYARTMRFWMRRNHNNSKKKYLRGIPPTCGDDSEEVTRSRLCLVLTRKTAPLATCTEWNSQSRSDGTGFGEHRNELAFLMQADRVVTATHVLATDEHVRNRPLSRPIMQSRLKSTSIRFRFEVEDCNVRKGFGDRVQAQGPSFRLSSRALGRSSRALGGVFRACFDSHVHI